MISVTIAQRKTTKQDKIFNSKEGAMNFKAFLANLIREYATHKSDAYYLDISDIPHIDKKAFLSHIVHINDYEYFTENEIREREAIKEYEDEMQHFIDSRLDEIYHEDMEEMGLYLCRHRDNGEHYWSRR